MDEVINMVAKKAGITKDQARKAVDAMLEYVHGNLPAPIAKMIDAAMAGDTEAQNKLVGGVAGLMGGGKDATKEASDLLGEAGKMLGVK